MLEVYRSMPVQKTFQVNDRRLSIILGGVGVKIHSAKKVSSRLTLFDIGILSNFCSFKN